MKASEIAEKLDEVRGDSNVYVVTRDGWHAQVVGVEVSYVGFCDPVYTVKLIVGTPESQNARQE